MLREMVMGDGDSDDGADGKGDDDSVSDCKADSEGCWGQ